jgi:ethanolamine ammonia-lyase small subunit
MTAPIDTPPVTANAWSVLRRFTPARIGLGRAGVSLPTAPQLAFQLAHAQARDAVHLALDFTALCEAMLPLGLEVLTLHSAAPDRDTYLQRPDLGRRLCGASRDALTLQDSARGASAAGSQERSYDVAFVVADGLSSLAVGTNAPAFLGTIVPRLQSDGWSVAPLALVAQGRVAVADEIGELLKARLVVVLIGERPGLSSPDSMGIYLTWMPRVGLTDASRNCISNVRAEGMPIAAAADKLHYLMAEARRRALSGVDLKDESQTPGNALVGREGRNFLLGVQEERPRASD